MRETQVLNFLRKNRDQHVSGEELSKKLKVSRSAIWKEMQNLRDLGYEIEAQPHLGYRLTSVPDKLFSDELSYELGTSFIGREIFSYESLDSTNDTCFQLGEKGHKEGACVFAEYQKKGKGRLGRSWTAPKGKNILFSVLLRPQLMPVEAARATLVTAVSIAKILSKTTGKKIGIKWPNDIFYSGKKIGGVLTEMSAETDRVNFLVVGIGLNVNAEPHELPPRALSLKTLTGSPHSRLALAKELLKQLEEDYLRLKKGSFETLAHEWEEYSVTSGKRVTASVMGQNIQGQAVGIDAEGALWIRKDNGLQERILAGDVEPVW